MNFRLSTLNYYIIQRISVSLFVSLIVLLTVLSLERLLRIVQKVTEHNGSGFKIFELLVYLLPHYLGLAIPAAVFLSIMLCIRGLQDDLELTVVQNAGTSLRALYKPIFMIVVPATCIMIILTGFAQPHARYAYRAVLHEVLSENPLAGLEAGVFYDINDYTTVRVNRIIEEDNILENVFIAHEDIDSLNSVYISAEKGFLTEDEAEKQVILRLKNGTIIQENKRTKKIVRVNFGNYPWTMSGLLEEPYGTRGQDEREMNFKELFKGQVSGSESETSDTQINAEFHSRLVMSLSLPFLAIWALPLALIGKGRTGKAFGIVLGAGLLIFYEKILGLGEAYVAIGTFSAAVSLWFPWLILGLTGLLIMRQQTPQRL